MFNRNLADDNYISFDEFEDYVREDNYDMVKKSFKYQYPQLDETLEVLLRIAATHGKINAIRAAVDYGFATSKLGDLMAVAAEQGQLDIVKLLIEEFGIDPTYRDNIAIKIAGDNKSIREYLLSDQRVIDRLVSDDNNDLLPDNIKDIFIF